MIKIRKHGLKGDEIKVARLHFAFNTVLIGVDKRTGDHLPDYREKVTVLRGLIMSTTDGVIDVVLSRTHMVVEYVEDLVSRDAVIAAVHQAVSEVAGAPELRLFPLRGSKVPAAVLVQPRHQRMIVDFNSDLYSAKHLVGKKGKLSRKKLAAQLEPLRLELVSKDGVRGLEFAVRQLVLVFDRQAVTAEEIERHIGNALEHRLRTLKSPVFPFGKIDTVTISYRVVDDE